VVCCSSVEDQDSSSEGGLSSNWWVLGSQGRDSLSTTGDATLQALPQPALSPFGAQNTQQQTQSVNNESASKNCSEQSRNESQKASDKQQDRNEEKQSNDVETTSGRNQVEDRREKREANDKGLFASTFPIGNYLIFCIFASRAKVKCVFRR